MISDSPSYGFCPVPGPPEWRGYGAGQGLLARFACWPARKTGGGTIPAVFHC